MAFSSTIEAMIPLGGETWLHFGNWATDSTDTTGNVDTGLRVCEALFLQTDKNGVATNAPSVDETLPADGSAVTIDFDASADGHWIALGRH